MPAEVVGALIAIGGVLLGSVVTAVVTLWVENTRQKAESTRQEQALAAERQRIESSFAHDSRMRQLEWRRAERKVVVDRARAFLDEVSLVVQQIGFGGWPMSSTGMEAPGCPSPTPSSASSCTI